MCSLELTGRRIDSLRDAPPEAARVASEVPGFTSVDVPIGESYDHKNKAIEWFKEDTLELPIDAEDIKVRSLQLKGLKLFERLQKASRILSI